MKTPKKFASRTVFLYSTMSSVLAIMLESRESKFCRRTVLAQFAKGDPTNLEGQCA